MAEIDSDALAAAIVKTMVEAKLPLPSTELMEFVLGPISKHQKNLIGLYKQLASGEGEPTIPWIVERLADIGYQLNEDLFRVFTKGAELSNLVRPPGG